MTAQTSPSLYAVVGGQSYSAFVAFTPSGSTLRTVEAGISWYTSAGAYISSSFNTNTEVADEWVQAGGPHGSLQCCLR